MANISVLNLEKVKLKNGGTITNVPGIDQIKTRKHGNLFVKKYFLNWKNIAPRMIRFTSKDKSFKQIYSMDVCNKLMEPQIGFALKEDTPIEKIVLFLTGVSEVKDLRKKQAFSFKIKRESFNQSELYQVLSESKAEARANLAMLIMSLAMTLLSISLIIWFYIKQVINWKIEQETYAAENEINNELFQGQTEDDSAFDIYNDIVQNIHNITKGNAVAMIMCGPPGMSKSYIVRRTFHFDKLKPGKDYDIQKGATAKVGDVYQMLFNARQKILVLDDFDTPLQDPNMVNFLKSITDSYSRRIISMPRSTTSDTQGQTAYDTPDKFEFKGKLIIITNLKREDIDRALLSRCPTISVKYDTKQVLDALSKLLKYVNPNVPMKYKEEVFKFIKQMKLQHKDMHVDFRSFKNSVDARVGLPESWKKIVLAIHGIGNF